MFDPRISSSVSSKNQGGLITLRRRKPPPCWRISKAPSVDGTYPSNSGWCMWPSWDLFGEILKRFCPMKWLLWYVIYVTYLIFKRHPKILFVSKTHLSYLILSQHYIHGNLRYPPQGHPPKKWPALIFGLIKGNPMGFHSPLTRPAIYWGGLP